jgi:hypothetical protein
MRKQVVALVDDLDGGPADQTVQFGLGDEHYEVDLSGEHAAALRKALAPFAAAARHVAGPKPLPSRVAFTAVKLVDPTAVRAWANARGITLPARRKIPAEVIEQFEAAGY